MDVTAATAAIDAVERRSYHKTIGRTRSSVNQKLFFPREASARFLLVCKCNSMLIEIRIQTFKSTCIHFYVVNVYVYGFYAFRWASQEIPGTT